MKLLKCAIYLSITGIIGFFAGRIIPRQWLNPQKGLFSSFSFEKDGKIYGKLKIRRWQNKVLDMSRILPFWMPAKNLKGNYKERLQVMIDETCVAEVIHIAISIFGGYCVCIWPGIGGITVAVINILFLNLPYILIQRYNRPRLIRLQRQLSVKKEGDI